MQFCKECENKLFPVEEDNKLWNKCMDCGFKEEYTDIIIEKKNYKNTENQTSDNSRFIIFDSAIPRTIHKKCPNKDCPSVEEPSLQEAVFIQDPVTIKLTYICVNCNTEWKYS
jgi:DNA-directed RNA polymerase subunit M/transcription elongation factor TFIIS